MSKVLRNAVVALLCGWILLGAACGSGPAATPLPDGGVSYSGGGPVDGTWKETGLTCNGAVTTGHGTVTVTISNTTGTSSYADSNGCVQNEPATVSYPNTSSFTWTGSGTSTCSGTCQQGCGNTSSDGGPNSPQTFTYARSGNTLTITEVQNGNEGDCGPGQTVQYTLQKQ